MHRARHKQGVTIVELIIAIVILGLIAALAIPRFSHAGQDTVEDELRHRLSVLRTAIELYRSQHDGYPGAIDGVCTDEAGDLFAAQLTGRTGANGRPCEAGQADCFGPYIRNSLAGSPLRGTGSPGRVYVWTQSGEPHASAEIDADWLFDCRTGYLVVNDPEMDSERKRFDQY